METIKVRLIGAAAQESLMKAAARRWVAGVTSKGAFLRADDRVLFLTNSDYRSPFNLTLNSIGQLFTRLQPGDTFETNKNEIVFSGREITLLTHGAAVWHPPQPARMVASLQEQRLRANLLLDTIKSIDPDKGFLFLAGQPDDQTEVFQREIHHAARQIVLAYRSQNKEVFFASAEKILGAGGGLTPSGDDFLTGFLLYHYRYLQSVNSEPGLLNEWWQELTRLAFKKTTTISANRLEYAGRGWAEEIFLTLIDHLFTPEVAFGIEKARHLVDFGHSSGVDTLIGISYGLDSLLV